MKYREMIGTPSNWEYNMFVFNGGWQELSQLNYDICVIITCKYQGICAGIIAPLSLQEKASLPPRSPRPAHQQNTNGLKAVESTPVHAADWVRRS